jgi:hypothetical protein
MRTAIAWLAAAVVVVAVLAACRARENFAADSATDDSARGDGTATDTAASMTDSASTSMSVPPKVTKGHRKPQVGRAGEPARDMVPDDSIRAMQPELPQVRPEKRPRTWRGLKLPEEIPVRPPVEPILGIERVPDSVQKQDSTKPPKPDG